MLMGVAARAFAHDPPEIRRLWWKPGGDEMVMLTNRGLIMGNVAQRSFTLMCNEAVGVGSSELPDLALLDDGRMLMASSAGLKRSDDRGCSWQGVDPFASALVPAMAQHPTEHATLYLAVFEKGNGGIRVSHDGGVSFETLLRVADNDFIQELVVAASNPALIYASGEVFDTGGKFKHYISRSADAGKSWERFELTVLDTEADVALLAVHPADPDQLLLKTIARNPATDRERLLISRDGGRSSTQVFDSEAIYDVSLGADHDTLWIGTSKGLWRSPDRGATFERVGGDQVLLSCVTEHAGELWACGYFGQGANGISVSRDAGKSFESRMAFTDVASPVACEPGASTPMLCGSLWSDWQREILGGTSAGAGGAGAGSAGSQASAVPGAGLGTSGGAAGGEGARDPLPATGSGCSLTASAGSTSSSAAWATLSLLLYAALRRSPRVSRARPRR